MNRKILSVLAIVLCGIFVAGVAMADLPADPNRRIKSTVVTSSGFVSTSVINSNDLILGYTVVPTYGTAGALVGLYDTSAIADGGVFDENEVSSTTGSMTKWFPYAKQIVTQLYVYISTNSGTAAVTIYYEDK